MYERVTSGKSLDLQGLEIGWRREGDSCSLFPLLCFHVVMVGFPSQYSQQHSKPARIVCAGGRCAQSCGGRSWVNLNE
jgi:hypothetical protein